MACSVANADPVDACFENVATAYRVAHSNHDFAGLDQLVYWESVLDADKARMHASLRQDLDREIEMVQVVMIPQDQITEYKLGGVTYRPNLAPERKLSVSFKKNDSTFEVTGSSYLLGRHDEKCFIATAAPTK